MARRTLTGRTLVVGRARRDVLSVTLRTPRDIRTVVPVGGAFLAVYDGALYGGEVVARAHLRDGRTVTFRTPAATPW